MVQRHHFESNKAANLESAQIKKHIKTLEKSGKVLEGNALEVQNDAITLLNELLAFRKATHGTVSAEEAKKQADKLMETLKTYKDKYEFDRSDESNLIKEAIKYSEASFYKRSNSLRDRGINIISDAIPEASPYQPVIPKKRYRDHEANSPVEEQSPGMESPYQPIGANSQPVERAPPVTAHTVRSGNGINLEREIGRGAYGICYLGEADENFKNTMPENFFVNGKVVTKLPTQTDNSVAWDELMQEAMLNQECFDAHQSQAKTRYVVNPGVLVNRDGNIALISRHAENSDAVKYLERKSRESYFNRNIANELAQMFDDLYESMEFLHSQNLIHRDIAARNILIDENGRVVLSDLGRTVRVESNLDSGFKDEENTGPIRHMDDISLRERFFSRASDLFSMKITMLELVTKAVGLDITNDLFGGTTVAEYLNHRLAMDKDKKLVHDNDAILKELFNRLFTRVSGYSPENLDKMNPSDFKKFYAQASDLQKFLLDYRKFFSAVNDTPKEQLSSAKEIFTVAKANFLQRTENEKHQELRPMERPIIGKNRQREAYVPPPIQQQATTVKQGKSETSSSEFINSNPSGSNSDVRKKFAFWQDLDKKEQEQKKQPPLPQKRNSRA